MDRFSKTIDTDTAEFANIEDSTPTKHSRLSKVIAIIVCFFLALIMWLYVMEISTDEIEKSFDNVQYIKNGVTEDANITVKVVGKRSFIADAKRSDITVYSSSNDNYTVLFTIDGKKLEGIEVVDKKIDQDIITLTVAEKK